MPSNNKGGAKARRQTAMPQAAAPPPPPPPPAATTTAAQRAATAKQQAAPDPDAAPQVPQQEGPTPQPAPAAPERNAEETTTSTAPQHQAPTAQEPQDLQGAAEAVAGNSLEKALGIPLGNLEPSNLATEIPREIPRGDASGGYGMVLPQSGPRIDPASRRDKVRGKKRHPRLEAGQLNPGVRAFNANAVRVYADEQAMGLGVALDEIIETGMRVLAPDIISREYALRCRDLGAPNDWPDTRRELLREILQQVPPQMVVEVYQELTQPPATEQQ